MHGGAVSRYNAAMRLLLVLVLVLSACATPAGKSEAPAAQKKGLTAPAATAHEVPEPVANTAADAGRVVLFPAGREPVTVDVEVVYKPADRQRGLMYRKSLAEDAGMIFLFEHERQQSFWMKNTYLPLDMIFIRADRSVLGVVENAEPLTLSSRRVPGMSQFVLEVNAGFARKHGVVAGTMTRFEDMPALAEVGAD